MFNVVLSLVKGNARAKLPCLQIAETLDQEEIAGELCQEVSKSNLTPAGNCSEQSCGTWQTGLSNRRSTQLGGSGCGPADRNLISAHRRML
jgi:hypothetical protein